MVGVFAVACFFGASMQLVIRAFGCALRRCCILSCSGVYLLSLLEFGAFAIMRKFNLNSSGNVLGFLC
jgi:hypothetical protein